MQLEVYQSDNSISFYNGLLNYIYSDYDLDNLEISSFEVSRKAWMSRVISLIDLPKQAIFFASFTSLTVGGTLLASCWVVARLISTCVYGVFWTAQANATPDYLPDFFNSYKFKELTHENLEKTIENIKFLFLYIGMTGGGLLFGALFMGFDLGGCLFPPLGKIGRGFFKEIFKDSPEKRIAKLNIAIENVNKKHNLQLSLIQTDNLDMAKKAINQLYRDIHPDHKAPKDQPVFNDVFTALSDLIDAVKAGIKNSKN